MRKSRIALFFLIVPGTLILFLPLLLGIIVFPNPDPFRPLRPLAALCWVIGGTLARRSVREFFVAGSGSPSPADPPKNLVITGPFRYTRNPIYLGALTVLFGHLLFFQSRALLVYLPLVFFLFRSIVVFREEPLLRRQFGEAYVQYCRDVPRWFGWRRGDGSRSPDVPSAGSDRQENRVN